MLTFHSVSKKFPIYRGWLRRKVGEVCAVDEVSFRVEEGSIHALVGESGSGKTTLGRMAARLLTPTAGKILYKNTPLEDFKDLLALRRSLQIVFQDSLGSLNPRHNVLRALGDGLLLHGLATPDQLYQKVSEALRDVGLPPEVMERYPHQFSGGQQQRICLARALMLGSHFLVLDEAVSAQDVSIQAQILELLRQLQQARGLSYLFITHDLAVVQRFADTVTVMEKGRLVESGPTESIFQNPQQPYTQALLRSIPVTWPRRSQIV